MIEHRYYHQYAYHHLIFVKFNPWWTIIILCITILEPLQLNYDY